MISFLKRMWRAAPWATTILALAMAAGVFFGTRTVASWVYWNDPARRDQPIAAWMTPRYVTYSWRIPRKVMIDALGSPNPAEGFRNFEHLAQDRGIPVDELMMQIEDAIVAFRATQGSSGSVDGANKATRQ
ncbi:hypothetical protein [Aliiroseovarius sediminis]|uniref:hypothetical protein n=1 Tax=Aliiroseovarius sediminis TaxID=2925839 RepID=UPI001F59CA09|nr:hypothetical protein [Aliiroseovarius sediminis]MCI2393161.1 hypothetical protein [Aliiroseovarius sediminis]